jgi:hypothetical protein
MIIDISSITIQTPMMQELESTLKQWVLCGFTGGLITGDARLGKTQALRSLSHAIIDRQGDPIPIYRMVFGQRDKPTIKGVYNRLLRSIGKKDINARVTSDIMLDEILIFFTDAAIVNVNRKIVLIVDEAQELVVDQLSAFVELFNELEEIGTHLSIFFVANKDRFQRLAKQLNVRENRYILERFFNYIHPFYGIRSKKELWQCLSWYDKQHIDIDKTCSYTHYFCPQSKQKNFKLSNITEDLWQLWTEQYARPFNYDSWGMTYFIRTVNVILVDYFPQYWQEDSEVIYDILEKSLAAAGNEPTLQKVFSHAS